MIVTTSDVSAVITEVREFERNNFGVKNGTDFPAFAAALANCKEFTDLCGAATAVGLLSALLVPKKDELDANPNATKDFMDKSPIRNIIADALYIGYRLGKREQETEVLNGMIQ